MALHTGTGDGSVIGQQELTKETAAGKKLRPLGNLTYPYTHMHIVIVHGIGDQASNETALNFMNRFLRTLPQGREYQVEVDNLN